MIIKRQKKIKFNDKEYFDIFTTEGTENLNKLDGCNIRELQNSFGKLNIGKLIYIN